MPILQRQEVEIKNWCVSVGLTNRSVKSILFWRVASATKKLTFSFDQSAVNLIIEWNELISLINSFSDTSIYPQIKKYIVNIPPQIQIIADTNYCIWWNKLCDNYCSANLFVSFIRKFKNIIY